MLCRNPYIGRGGAAYPCGQCMPCRISRRRVWTHRIMLEALQYQDNTFVTLTYSDSAMTFVPPSIASCTSQPLPTLVPRDLQLWLKRFRKRIAPWRIRFYACGEYGDETERPHYHAAIFNFPGCARGQTKRVFGTYGGSSWRDCCDTCRLVGETWGLGDVFLGTLGAESAQYICGYVTKKMTGRDDTRLDGRHPEFARMSNQPGIGYSALHEVASQLLEFNLVDAEGDVPSALRHGSRLMPLGRYLRRELRALVGMEKTAPRSTLLEAAVRLLDVREAAFNNSRSFKKEIVTANTQKWLNMDTKMSIHRKGKQL